MRPIQALPVVLAVAALAGCGGGSSSGGSGTTDSSTAPATATQTTPAQTQAAATKTTPARPAGADGGKVFASAGCSGCHTLKAAGATGNVGPNLDDLKPSLDAVKTQVTNGGGGMPSFSGSLSSAEIDAVAAYVSSNAGK